MDNYFGIDQEVFRDRVQRGQKDFYCHIEEVMTRKSVALKFITWQFRLPDGTQSVTVLSQ
jgi:hypothetical protein